MKPSILTSALAAIALVPWYPQQVEAGVNGTPDFEHESVGAIMLQEPGFPGGEWRANCSATLVTPRVLATAGHCVQQMNACLASGQCTDVRLTFQQDPFESFVPGHPEASGWLEIEQLVNNPDNPDWSNLESVFEIWGEFHDSGAVVLVEPVKGLKPARFPWLPGRVELLTFVQCQLFPHLSWACNPELVGYGLTAWPPAALNRRCAGASRPATVASTTCSSAPSLSRETAARVTQAEQY